MKYVKQFSIILGISFLAELLEILIPLPIAASVYGLVIMLVGLITKLIPLEKVEGDIEFKDVTFRYGNRAPALDHISFTIPAGKKVALVDCDLRKPVLHRYLKAGHNVKGVSNVLSNQCTLDEALHELKEMNLTFLPAGTPPPNPSEMLSQPQMQAMVNTLREKFDVVIFDAPPVSVVTDAAVIGRYVDGAVFVVRSDFAPADAVRGAVKKLQDAGVRVLGSVLTRYDMKKALKGSSYAYSYAYNYNYAYEKQKADVTE